jgi:hypothetical protein
MSTFLRTRLAILASLALVSTSAFGCGGRDSVWDTQPPSPPQVVGLNSAVALVDDPTHRVVMLVGKEDQQLDRVPFSVGHTVVKSEASPDKSRLFVLSAGDYPRRSERDERPSVTVIEGTPGDLSARRFTLSSPLSGLSVDPRGKWAALYAGGSTKTVFVENPNELVLIDLEAPPGPTNPVTRTIRSFGGRPQRVTFSPTLSLPGGPRRLLVVETEQDLAIVDLDHARDTEPREEITIPLTSGTGGHTLKPAGVVFDDGDPGRDDDSRIGLRIENDTNVVTIDLAAATPKTPPAPNDFEARLNMTDVGGIASDIAFVRTDGGIRLAALVPSIGSAVLIEPETSVTTPVKLPRNYQRLSLITDVVGTGTGTDVALLWNATESSSGVAFWALGKTAGQPYRSVEVVSLGGPVTAVNDIPKPRPELKVLEISGGGAFYVLNLSTRTAAPLLTNASAALSVSPDGERVWAFQSGSTQLASIDLRNIHPVPMVTDRPISSVFDIARPDGGRALVAVHGKGNIGATVLDARNPDTASARLYSALLLEGL